MKIRGHLVISISIFLIAIILGSFVYVSLEGWRFLDALYFTAMTVTTVGYGDIVPITDAGKIFTILFSFFGIAMAFYFLGVLGRELFKEHLSGKVSEIKREVQKDEEIKTEIEKDIISKGKKKKS